MKEILNQKLANPSQTPYSKGGGIFMPENGGGKDMSPNSQPTGSEVGTEKTAETIKKQNIGDEILKPGSAESVKQAEDAWIKHNEGRKLSLEEKTMQRLLRALGKMPGEALSLEQSEEVKRRVAELLADPSVQDVVKEGQYSQAASIQEAVQKRKAERLTPIEVLGQLHTIDTAGIFDTRLRETAITYNRKLRKGLIEYGDIDRTVREVEDRLRDLSIPNNERDWARGVIDALETSMMDVKRQREAEQEKAERSYRERETGQKKYTIDQLIKDRKTRDEVFNDLFAGVDSTPHEFFDRAFNPLTYGMRYETFMDLIREASVGKLEGYEDLAELSEAQQRELADDFIRYQTERRVRQTLHDVNAAVYIPSLTAEQLYDHMQGFSSELEDFAFREAGVKQMTDLYEEAIRESMMKKNGYLDPQQIVPTPITVVEDGKPRVTVPTGEIEHITKDRFRKRLAGGTIIVRDENGVAQTINPDPQKGLRSWEVDRIFTVARGMMITTERLISLAAESKLPKNSFASLFLNDIIKTVSPYHNAIGKFGVGEKDLAAYMYEQDELATSENPAFLRSLFNFLERWDPSELQKTLKKFESGPYDNFMNDIQNEDDMVYLMLRNPNRAGDIYTWLSWRMQEIPENTSMSQAFLQKGLVKMTDRLSRLEQADPNFLERFRENPQETKDQLRRKYLNEYSSWLGTGLRLERIRTSLSMKEDELRELRKLDKNKGEQVDKDRAKGEKILGQMVKLQPHRLYLVSGDIRERIGNKLTVEQKEALSDTLDDLHLVEQALLAKRENLLEQGLIFNELTLDNYYDAIADTDQEKQDKRRNRAKQFAELIRDDFTANEISYRDEFLRMKREWKHAYVLWSGDAPVDEFNATALGPNAAVARRARDNKAQGEAVTAEVKLLMALKEAVSPDQIYELLIPIYDKVTDYDAGKAKQVIAEKVEGIIKFYQADTLTNVPVLGQLMRQLGLSSFAQLTFQSKRAGVWQANECYYLLDKLASRNYIERWQYNALKAKVHATRADVGIDIASTMSQFIAVALAWYLAEKLLKEEK